LIFISEFDFFFIHEKIVLITVVLGNRYIYICVCIYIILNIN